MPSTELVPPRFTGGTDSPFKPPNQVEQVTLKFRNICYEVSKKKGFIPWRRKVEKKVILEGISGEALPGDFIALMGASGAGKSTLLNVLSRRITMNDGEVFVNDVLADKTSFARDHSCFIQQEDLFYGFITVTEHLSQQAELRVAADLSKRTARVRDVMDGFSLNKSRDSRVGNIEQGASRGISGGEKKRLSVASELLTNPSLIFADEPTSGLDSFMAESVCDVLRNLADSGHTVICTIHQPSSDVFAMFNKLILLSEGRLLYMGPRLAAIPYFLRLGHPCPPYTNPADFFIELCSIDWENPADKLQELSQWYTHWKNVSSEFLHEWETDLKHKFALALESTPTSKLGSAEEAKLAYESPVLHDKVAAFQPDKIHGRVKTATVLSTLLKRNIIATSRNPSVVRARLLQAIITALLGGFVYFRLGNDAAYSKSGACFFICVNQGFMSVYTCLTAFMGEKRIVIRERDSGLFPLYIYYLAKVLSDFLFQFYLPILYGTIVWFLMGLNDDFVRYLLGTLFIFWTSVGVASIGYIIAAIAPNHGVAVALGPIIILPCLLVAGFVIQKESLPSFWIWLYYGSPFVYAFSGLMRAVFLDVEFNLPPSEEVVNFSNGNDVLKSFSISLSFDRWFIDAGALIAWFFLGRLLGLVLFLLCNRKRKK